MDEAWDAYPTDLSPTAERTGPFPQRPFLETVWRHREDASSHLLVATDEDGAVALSVDETTVTFAGQSNLTDYHSPLGTRGAEAVVAAVLRSGRRFDLDSLPLEVATAIRDGLVGSGVDADLVEHEVTAVLDLPTEFDAWLASIGKKERHEVRRKRRRFEETFGPISLERGGLDAIEAFCSAHRGAAGAKGEFMTGAMEQLFSDLISNAGASIHTLTCDGIPRAHAFGFETDDAFYFYNSAYDQDAAMVSPGIVLLSALIENQIERGTAVFDFLKGDERYKFKHGARRRPLFAVRGVVA